MIHPDAERLAILKPQHPSLASYLTSDQLIELDDATTSPQLARIEHFATTLEQLAITSHLDTANEIDADFSNTLKTTLAAIAFLLQDSFPDDLTDMAEELTGAIIDNARDLATDLLD